MILRKIFTQSKGLSNNSITIQFFQSSIVECCVNLTFRIVVTSSFPLPSCKMHDFLLSFF